MSDSCRQRAPASVARIAIRSTASRVRIRVLAATLSGLLCLPAAGAASERSVGAFLDACLDGLPNFIEAGDAFVKAGFRFDGYYPNGGRPPIARFGEIARGDGSIQLRVPNDGLKVNICTFSPARDDRRPHRPMLDAVERRIATISGRTILRECRGVPGRSRCDWWWRLDRHCVVVKVSVADARAWYFFAAAFETGRPCEETV
ncbi:MAG: hypothetical protein ACFBSD_09275 [Paracoccaceae bacterium]